MSLDGISEPLNQAFEGGANDPENGPIDSKEEPKTKSWISFAFFTMICFASYNEILADVLES